MLTEKIIAILFYVVNIFLGKFSKKPELIQIKKIANIIVIIGEYFEQNSIDLEDGLSLLTNEALPDFLKNIGEELNNFLFI